MTKQQIKDFRAALIALLDDENGVNHDGYCSLMGFANSVIPETCDDIATATDGMDGRVFLPEGHELTP